MLVELMEGMFEVDCWTEFGEENEVVWFVGVVRMGWDATGDSGVIIVGDVVFCVVVSSGKLYLIYGESPSSKKSYVE